MKILIELPTWLGDAVMATPAIENIFRNFVDADVTLIGSFASIELLRHHPKVSGLKVIDKKYLSLFKLSRKLGKFDNYFSFRSSIRSKIFKFFVISNKKYQFNK